MDLRRFWGVPMWRVWLFGRVHDLARMLAPPWMKQGDLTRSVAERYRDRWDWLREQESRERLAFEAVASARGDLK